MFMFIDIKERGRGRQRETHTHGSFTSCTHPDRGLDPQSWHVPWLRIEPPNFCCTGQRSNQLSHTDKGNQCPFFFLSPFIVDFYLNETLSSCISPGQVAQLERSPDNTKVADLVPLSGHIQESTNECINEWNRKLLFSSLFHPVSLKPINK